MRTSAATNPSAAPISPVQPLSVPAPERAPVGVVLTGGGARGAYQAGVISALMDILDPHRDPNFKSPFSIVCGTSAGSINAAGLACYADAPHEGAERMRQLWGGLRTHDIFEADGGALLRTGWRWFTTLSLGWMMPNLRRNIPHSLLNNTPLRRLLQRTVDFDRLKANLHLRYLDALAITATAYTTGEHLTFYQSEQKAITPWHRSLRRAIPCRIGVDHLLASSAIPFVFPAQAILVAGGIKWCGDGTMRQLAPISPAIHLGAEKVVIIGTGFNDETYPDDHVTDPAYPSLAQIAGHTLSNIFLDSVAIDIERMERINQLLSKLPPEVAQAQPLKQVSTFSITPSQSIDEIAIRHYERMPRSARALFRVLGVSAKSGPTTGGSLISYLLFESAFTQELIELGRSDTMNRLEEVKAFFKESSQ